MHFSGQLNCWSLRCSWSSVCWRCSNYIFIVDLTPGFNILRQDNCKPRWETSKFWDLVCLILQIFTVCVIWGESRAEYITLLDGPRQMKLWTGQVDLARFLVRIIHNLFWKTQNFRSRASENIWIYQVLGKCDCMIWFDKTFVWMRDLTHWCQSRVIFEWLLYYSEQLLAEC